MSHEEDVGMRARVAGRVKVASTIVWSLEFPGVAFRCRKLEEGFRVEENSGKGWREFTTGIDATALLRKMTNLPAIERFIAK